MDTIVMVMPKSTCKDSDNSNTQNVQGLIKQFLHPENGLPDPLLFSNGHKHHFEIEENGLNSPLSTVLS